MGELAATLLALAAVMSGHVTAAPGEGAGAAVPVRISVHDVDVVEGSWPGTRAAFEVQLSSPADHPVEVQFETQDDTALEGVDYLARRGSLVIEPGQTNATVQIPIISDKLGEANETFRLRLHDPVGGELDRDTATATITDDDLPIVQVLSFSVPEGQSGTRLARVPIVLSNPSALAVSVRVTPSDLTAVAGEDYLGSVVMVSFPPGTVRQEVEISVLGDLLAERNETVGIVLSDPVNAALSEIEGNLLILDDDPVPTISVTGVALPEGNADFTEFAFVIRLSGPSSQPVRVNYTTESGTATGGSDFVVGSGQLTFPPGSTETVVSVPVLGDTTAEFDETFYLVLQQPDNATLRVSRAEGLIRDDDSLPRITIVNATTIEGGPGETNEMSFAVRVSSPVTNTITVNYETRSVQAQGGSDYLSTTGKVTFVAFDPGVIQHNIVVPIIGDDRVERDEIFQVRLSNPTNAVLDRVQATGTILNDDGLVVRAADASVTEGDPGDDVRMVFRITLSEPQPTPTRVSYYTEASQSSATSGRDFTAVNGQFTFQPGETERILEIKILPDTDPEGDESFFLGLIPPNRDFVQAIGTIVDDDLPAVIVDDVTVLEGSSGPSVARFAVRLTAGPQEEARLRYMTTAGTATAGQDFLNVSGTLVFPPGVSSQPIDVPILGDTVDEAEETFALHLSDPQGLVLTATQVTGRIRDDDPLPVLSIEDVPIAECMEPDQEAAFLVRLSTPTEQEVSAQFQTLAGTATAGLDYVDTFGRVTFPPGTTEAFIPVSIFCDSLDEEDEFFELRLEMAENAIIGEGLARGWIFDDGLPELVVTGGSVTEGDAGVSAVTVELALSSPSLDFVTVDYATTNLTATEALDYHASSGRIVFAPGEVQRTLMLQIVGDDLSEGDESFGLLLTNVVNARLASDSVEIVIVDDDLPALEVDDVTVLEGNAGETIARVVLRLSHASPVPVIVDHETVSDTATAGADFIEAQDSVVIPAGETMAEIEVVIVGDTQPEGDERLVLRLTQPANAVLTRDEAFITIVDDDLLPIISLQDATVEEGTGGTHEVTLTIELSAPSTVPVSVTYATVSDTAIVGQDFVNVRNPVEFPPGTVARTITVILLGDGTEEPDESFLLALSNPVNGVLARTHARITILDDDGAGIRILDASLAEPDTGTTQMVFRVSLGEPSDGSVSVQYRTVDGTAVAGLDYESRTGTLTFPAGSTEQQIPVVIRGDSEDEPSEMFEVRLFDPRNAVVSRAEAVGTILDTDPPAIRINDTSITVSNRAVDAVFTVSLSSSSPSAIEVDYATRDGSAVAGSDYTTTSGRIEFPPGVIERTVTVPVLANTTGEGDEFFFLELSAPVEATIGKERGTAVVFQALAPNNAPSVALTSPANGASFTAGDDITLQATATDPEGDALSVVFFNGDLRIGEAAAPPYSLVWSNVAAGMYTLTAHASDPGGLISTSSPVNITVEAAPLLSVGPVTVSEGDGIAQFPITLSRPRSRPVSVTALVREATALVERDFIAATNRIVFNPGETNRHFDVHLVDDSIHEATETLRVELSQPENAGILRDNAVGTIEDDDPPPSLSVTGTRVIEGDADTTSAAFLVTLSSTSDLPVSVDYTSRDGTAKAGTDYVATSGRLTIEPRLNVAAILVPVLGDTLFEPDETFEIALSSPVNATLFDPVAVATIANDDVELPQTNAVPVVQIIRPEPRTIFPIGDPILVEAVASDPDGVIERVEFLVGAVVVGEDTEPPFTLAWRDAPAGDHAIRARAYDAEGAMGESPTLRVAVSELCGAVAIIENVADPEIEILQDYLFELGVNSSVFARQDATLDALMEFDLILWHDAGARGLGDREVEFFEQLAGAGKALYFMGDALLESAEDLTPAARDRWMELIRLQSGPSGAAAGEVTIEADGLDPLVALVVREGKVGTIPNFTLPSAPASALSLGGLWDAVLARAGASDALVAYWDSSSTEFGRRLTQPFRVAGQGDADSLMARKRLFQNAVWWLLDCLRCSNLNLVPEVTVSPEQPRTGEEMAINIEVRLSGGCEALSVRVSCDLPDGLRFVRASAERGEWSHLAGVVSFTLGRLPRATHVSLQVIVTPERPGGFAADITLRSLNESEGSTVDNHAVAMFEANGAPVSPLRLEIERLANQSVELILNGTSGQEYVIETAPSPMGSWMPWTNVVLQGDLIRLPLPVNAVDGEFFRARR